MPPSCSAVPATILSPISTAHVQPLAELGRRGGGFDLMSTIIVSYLFYFGHDKSQISGSRLDPELDQEARLLLTPDWPNLALGRKSLNQV